MPGIAFAAAAAEPAKGETVCKISDEVLSELSGIAAVKDGYYVINDGTDDDAARKVFFLDGKCKIKNTINYAGTPPDTEDAVLSPDGQTLWIGNIGDNSKERKSVGVYKIDLTAAKPEPVYYRLRYPGDERFNAEALLIGGDGVPIVVTKEAAVAHLWIPGAPLEETEDGIEMKLAGEWKISPLTTTSTYLGVAGRMAVTGGAVAPGGAKVVLRTYADAFEWDVSNGDVVAAVTKGTPRVTGLPDEPFGEAITYSADGSTYVTVSEMPVGAVFKSDPPTLLKYTPQHNAISAAKGGDAQGDDRSLLERVSLGQITAAVVSIGLVGLALLIAGIAGIVMFRRRNPAPLDDEPVKGRGESGDADRGRGPESSGANRREPAAAAAGAVYGGGPAGMNGGGSGAVYGAGNSGAVRGGAAAGGAGVYGGGPGGMNGGGSGAVYGAGAAKPGAAKPGVAGGGVPGVPGGKPGVAGGGAPGVPGGKPGVAGGGKPGAPYGGGPGGMNGGGSGAVYGAGGAAAAPGGRGGQPPRGDGGPRGAQGGGGPARGGRGPQDPQQSGGVYAGGPGGLNGGGSGAVYGGARGQGGGTPPQGGGRGPGPRGGGGPQQSGGNPQQGGRPRGPQQGGGDPQQGRGPQQGGGRPPRQPGGGGGVYGGGPEGMNNGGSGAVRGDGGDEQSGGYDRRRDGQRGDYPQNPPYDDRRR